MLSHALSYAFVTSRNTTYRSCFLRLFLLWLIMLFMIVIWSAVDLPDWPPACASVVFISFFTRLFTILSNTLPMLLASVIPLSLLHLPFSPFPLYILIISPSCHSLGIVSSWYNWFITFRYISLVSRSASIIASFGILSGPVLFFPF